MIAVYIKYSHFLSVMGCFFFCIDLTRQYMKRNPMRKWKLSGCQTTRCHWEKQHLRELERNWLCAFTKISFLKNSCLKVMTEKFINLKTFSTISLQMMFCFLMNLNLLKNCQNNFRTVCLDISSTSCIHRIPHWFHCAICTCMFFVTFHDNHFVKINY